MTRWEYCFVDTKWADMGWFQVRADGLGLAGWELIGFAKDMMVFKRPLP